MSKAFMSRLLVYQFARLQPFLVYSFTSLLVYYIKHEYIRNKPFAALLAQQRKPRQRHFLGCGIALDEYGARGVGDSRRCVRGSGT